MRIPTPTLTLIIIATVAAGVLLLMPLGESNATHFVGHGTGFGLFGGAQLICPQGYVLIGSLCHWQGFGQFGQFGQFNQFGSPFGFGFNNPFLNNSFSGFGESLFNNFSNVGFRPDIDFRADDTSIDESESTILRWDVDNANDCDASNSENDRDFRGDVNERDGAKRVRPDETTTYTLVCANRFGSSFDSVTIHVDEDDDDEIEVELTADDRFIDEGDSTVLRWDVEDDADRCEADNGEGDNDFEGRVDEDGGSERVRPNETTTYEVTCWNGDEEDSDRVTIQVDED